MEGLRAITLWISSDLMGYFLHATLIESIG